MPLFYPCQVLERKKCRNTTAQRNSLIYMELAAERLSDGCAQVNTLILMIGAITGKNSGGQTRLRSGRRGIYKMSKKSIEGWIKCYPSRKAHYFVDGESLCKKWAYDGKIRQKSWIDNVCKACDREFEKRQETLAGKQD